MLWAEATSDALWCEPLRFTRARRQEGFSLDETKMQIDHKMVNLAPSRRP